MIFFLFFLPYTIILADAYYPPWNCWTITMEASWGGVACIHPAPTSPAHSDYWSGAETHSDVCSKPGGVKVLRSHVYIMCVVTGSQVSRGEDLYICGEMSPRLGDWVPLRGGGDGTGDCSMVDTGNVIPPPSQAAYWQQRPNQSLHWGSVLLRGRGSGLANHPMTVLLYMLKLILSSWGGLVWTGRHPSW